MTENHRFSAGGSLPRPYWLNQIYSSNRGVEKYRSAVSGRMVTTVLPGPNFLAMAMAAATLDLARLEGLMCGISSGTNVAAAIAMAKKLGPGKTVVTILPDTAERYFSTPLFDE